MHMSGLCDVPIVVLDRTVCAAGDVQRRHFRAAWRMGAMHWAACSAWWRSAPSRLPLPSRPSCTCSRTMPASLPACALLKSKLPQGGFPYQQASVHASIHASVCGCHWPPWRFSLRFWRIQHGPQELYTTTFVNRALRDCIIIQQQLV